uniref:Homeobox domain-containing protein n=1 Tax=Anopheles quadriannulatus TaxID=34691 RepID=A0A182XBQ9_ANOQN
MELANKLGLSDTQVKTWYQNRSISNHSLNNQIRHSPSPMLNPGSPPGQSESNPPDSDDEEDNIQV